MRRFLQSFAFAILMLVASVSASAAITITKAEGWFESGYITFTANGESSIEVYVRPQGGNYTKLDKELVRNYGSYLRADAVGLKAGSYQFKVNDVESDVISVTAHDRSGFAHVGMPEGIGAYKNDGTLKDNAKVLYVWANNAKTVSTTVKIGSKDSNIAEYTGLQDIITAYQKGYDTTPLDIRIIGTIKAGDMDRFDSGAEGLQVKGRNAYSLMPITIEGIGDDATISGFGILCRNSKGVEFRNFAIMLCMDDCLSLDTENSNIWIHNMDFFYGKTGGDADQAKGDGTVDIKASSKNVTMSYNHFFDAGKCSLGGMSSETPTAWHTYHHNWFDHSDSRHPRIRVQFFHVYNNYYDGISKYGIGAAQGGTAFVEANYFRNCKYPILSSKQGTDAEGDGTFSGEPGGVVKAYNNVIINPRKIQYYTDGQTDGKWDAVLVTDRSASVSATAFSGGTGYNNEADQAARTQYIENKMDAPENVPAIVKANAGRMNGGDVKWSFNNSLQDENYAVISELKTMLQDYKSTLVGFADGTSIDNGGATDRVDGGDGKGIAPEVNDSYVPSWAGGGGTVVTGKPVIGSTDDYFWFNSANEAKVNEYVANGVITGGDFKPTQAIKASDGTVYSEYVGSMRLAQNASITFYHEAGIVSLDAYVSGNGSQSWQISTSADGSSFTDKGSAITGSKGSHPNVVYSGEAVKYVRITNKANGNRDVQGIKLFEEGEAEPDTRQLSDLTIDEGTKTINIGEAFKIDYTTSSTGAMTFSSSKSSVATVDANGYVTAVGEGDAEITVTQAADANYKRGVANVLVTVVDPRSESQFTLTSDGIVSIKQGETSQITTSGAAGNVTFSSNKPSIATVSSTGLITAVEAGSASITVTDSGTSEVKGSSITITVNVTKDMTGVEFCHFTGKKPSQSFVTESGSQWSTGNSFSYNGETYGDAAKINSKEKITITPPSDCTVKLYFDAANTTTTLDGELITLNAGVYSFSATAGKSYVLDKSHKDAKECKLFIVELTPATGGGGEGGEQGGDDPVTSAYLIDYPVSSTGVAIKGSTTESSGVIKLVNGYVGKVDGVENVPGNGILLTPEGGFKVGDIVSVAGTISVTPVADGTSQADYDKKIATTAKLASITADHEVTDVHTYAPFANTKETGVGFSGPQAYTMEAEYPELWLVRSGGTTASITFIRVERSTSTGISTISTIANGIIYDLQGRRISSPVKGQLYIVNGKKFILK